MAIDDNRASFNVTHLGHVRARLLAAWQYNTCVHGTWRARFEARATSRLVASLSRNDGASSLP
jgi:hypothetical protein